MMAWSPARRLKGEPSWFPLCIVAARAMSGGRAQDPAVQIIRIENSSPERGEMDRALRVVEKLRHALGARPRREEGLKRPQSAIRRPQRACCARRVPCAGAR